VTDFCVAKVAALGTWSFPVGFSSARGPHISEEECGPSSRCPCGLPKDANARFCIFCEREANAPTEERDF
jgi:hypothetical protein